MYIFTSIVRNRKEKYKTKAQFIFSNSIPPDVLYWFPKKTAPEVTFGYEVNFGGKPRKHGNGVGR